MSSWSSCNAIIYLYTHRNLSNFKDLINIALNHAPKITGSEGDCTYTAIDFAAGSSASFPCTNCPIYNRYAIKVTKTKCPGTHSSAITRKELSKCIMLKFDDDMRFDISDYYDRCKIIISDVHGLRDKTKEETVQEFNNFVRYLKKIYNGIFKVQVLCKKIQ